MLQVSSQYNFEFLIQYLPYKWENGETSEGMIRFMHGACFTSALDCQMDNLVIRHPFYYFSFGFALARL